MSLAAISTTDHPESAARRVQRPKWHRVYYALASFDIFTVCLSLLLSHQIMAIYTDSVEVNSEWAERLGGYMQLGSLASNVNAPGNRVFDNRNVALEVARHPLKVICGIGHERDSSVLMVLKVWILGIEFFPGLSVASCLPRADKAFGPPADSVTAVPRSAPEAGLTGFFKAGNYVVIRSQTPAAAPAAGGAIRHCTAP